MDGYIGEIRAFTWNWTPVYWIPCDGRLLMIQSYQALFSILGIRFGGDARTNFNVPNLQGRIVVGVGQGANLSPWTLNEHAGAETVTLTYGQSPAHNHNLNARISGVADSQAAPVANAMLGRVTETTGGVRPTWHQPDLPPTPVTMADQMVGFSGGQSGSGLPEAHENRQPVLVMSYCICYYGEYPTRN